MLHNPLQIYISHSNTCSVLFHNVPSGIQPSVTPAIYRQNGEVYGTSVKKKALAECADVIDAMLYFVFSSRYCDAFTGLVFEIWHLFKNCEGYVLANTLRKKYFFNHIEN